MTALPAEQNFICHHLYIDQGKLINHADTQKSNSAYEWIHLKSQLPEAYAWLAAKQLPAAVLDGLTATRTHPRTFKIDKNFFITLRAVNLHPESDPEDMLSISLWISEHEVISSLHGSRELLSIIDLKASIEAGEGPTTTMQFFIMLLERIVDRIFTVVDAMEESLSGIEELPEQHYNTSARTQLTLIRQQSATIKRYLSPQRDALQRVAYQYEFIASGDLRALQDQKDRIIRQLEDLELVRERILVLQEAMRNQLAEQQNSKIYALSLITAVFLPLSFLTGVFGMNVAGLPGTENKAAFLWVSAAMLALAGGISLFFYLKKWF